MESEEVGVEIIQALERLGIRAKLFGGVGVSIVSEWRVAFGMERPVKDLDLVIRASDRSVALLLLRSFGWQADLRSLMFSDRRLIRLRHDRSGMLLDLFSDPLHFNQTVKIGERGFSGEGPVLPLSYLMLTKLQIANPTIMDLRDIAALILTIEDRGLQGEDDWAVVIGACSNVWGLFWSATCNLGVVRESVLLDIESLDLREKISAGISSLLNRILRSDKSFRWRIRSLLGAQISWYQQVDD